MATIKACLSSLRTGLDWIRDTESRKSWKMDWLEGGPSASPQKFEKLIGSFEEAPDVFQAKII